VRNSKWFKEGYEAAKTDDASGAVPCPYLDRTPKFYIWHEGFNQKQRDDMKLPTAEQPQ